MIFNKIKNRQKFSSAEWKSRGLGMSSARIVQSMQIKINNLLDVLIENRKQKTPEEDITIIENYVQTLDLSEFDTEEAEWIYDYIHEIMEESEIPLSNKLILMVTGVDPSKKQIPNLKTNYIDSFRLENNCHSCNYQFNCRVIVNSAEIEKIGLVVCFNCGQKSFIIVPEKTKIYDIYNFRLLELIELNDENEKYIKGKV